jgi:hypothetical protein
MVIGQSEWVQKSIQNSKYRYIKFAVSEGTEKVVTPSVSPRKWRTRSNSAFLSTSLVEKKGTPRDFGLEVSHSCYDNHSKSSSLNLSI